MWTGRRPKKPKRGEEDSSSSEDEMGDEGEGNAAQAGGVAGVPLDDTPEVPPSAYARNLHVETEGAYWAAAQADATFVSSEGELISPCMCKGSNEWVHLECLRAWQKREESKHSLPSKSATAPRARKSKQTK